MILRQSRSEYSSGLIRPSQAAAAPWQAAPTPLPESAPWESRSAPRKRQSVHSKRRLSSCQKILLRRPRSSISQVQHCLCVPTGRQSRTFLEQHSMCLLLCSPWFSWIHYSVFRPSSGGKESTASPIPGDLCGNERSSSPFLRPVTSTYCGEIGARRPTQMNRHLRDPSNDA